MKSINSKASIGKFCLALSLSSVLSACGGGGGGGGGSTASANPYTGTYSGEFVDSSSTIDPCTLTIASNGAISGQFSYSTPVTFSGSVNSSGKGSITSSNGTFQVTLGKAGLPTLGGGMGTPANGFFITLITNPNDSFSGYAGDYAGTVQNTTLGRTGIIALSIGSSGAVSGVDLFDVNGTPTLESVSGSISSSGALSYKVAGVTVSGTVTLSSGTIAGSMSESTGDSANLSISQIG